jgi:hypothetical protein
MVHREHILQQWVRYFNAHAVAVPHEAAAHDRGSARAEYEHVREAARGLRPAWPDNEVALEGGRTFRCELKAPGVRLADDGQQARMLTRLNLLGHPSTWANSVLRYGEECERFGVPLKSNWRVVAQYCDQQVLAKIATEEAKANGGLPPDLNQRVIAEIGAPSVKAAKPKSKRSFRRRASPAQYARVQAARKPL